METAIYLKHGAARRGIGSELYEVLLKWTAQNNFKTAIAGDALIFISMLFSKNFKGIVVSRDTSASLAFHEKLGFEKTAHLKKVGWKFGQWIDVVMMQKYF